MKIVKVNPPPKAKSNKAGNPRPRKPPSRADAPTQGSELRTAKRGGVKAGAMTAQQRLFADEFLACRDYALAATKAGYAPSTAKNVGSRLRNEHLLVKAYIDERLALLEQRAVRKAEDVLQYIHTAMFYNPLRFFRPGDRGGWLIDEDDFHDLPDWVGCMIEEMEARTRTDPRTGDTTSTLWVRLVSKTKMAELAARHQLGEKVTVTRVNINWDDLAKTYDPSDPLDMKDDPIEARLREVRALEPRTLSKDTQQVVQGLVELLPPSPPSPS